MNILDLAIIVFIVMEMANVCILFFAPNFRRGNGVAVFNQWEKSKGEEASHLFARYMAYWVAGTKLIFIVLLLVILLTAHEETKIWAVAVMIISIASYYWRLHPIINKLDRMGEITPKGYAKTLSYMIAAFILMFTLALGIHFLR